MESVILSTPYLCICAVLSLLMIILGMIFKKGRYLSLVSALLTSFVVTASLILGAEIFEALFFALIELILGLASYYLRWKG